jgi:hypothetical protein
MSTTMPDPCALAGVDAGQLRLTAFASVKTAEPPAPRRVPRPPFRTPPADGMLALLSTLASTVERPSA